MSDALVQLRGFNTVHEAQLAASLLEASDIDCEVRNAYVGGSHPELFAGPVVVTLFVRAEDAESARTLLDTNASVSAAPDDQSTGATCAGCGQERPMATLLEYGHGMGIVLRCPGCDRMMLSIVRGRGFVRVDASGISLLAIPAVE